MKDIEFTVTTLNCPVSVDHDSSPNRRRKFSSLRKTGALSKVMRSRLSRSFYSSGCGGGRSDSHKKSDSVIVHMPSIQPALLEEKSNGTHDGDGLTSTPLKPEKHKKRSKLCLIL